MVWGALGLGSNSVFGFDLGLIRLWGLGFRVWGLGLTRDSGSIWI